MAVAVVVVKVVPKAEIQRAAHLAPAAMWVVTVWAIALHAMANAPSLVTVHHAAVNVQRAMAIASLEMDKAKALVRLASLTTVARAAMHHVHRVTLTHLAPHAVTTMTSSPAPTRTWAPKAA